MTRAETINKLKLWLDSAEGLQISNSEYAEILEGALYYLQEDKQTILRLAEAVAHSKPKKIF